jgi:hypothetical protein
MWRVDDDPWVGSDKSKPMPQSPFGTPTPPSRNSVLQKLDDEACGPDDDECAPVPAEEPDSIFASSGSAAGGASGMQMPDYYLAAYDVPLLPGGYGDAETVYFEAAIDRPPEVEPTVGYLVLNDGGANFTSLSIPDPLAGGESVLQIRDAGVEYDLAAGETFDFTAIDSAGIDSFVLDLIVPPAVLPTSANPEPFVFGMTFAADAEEATDASFLLIPLRSIPGDYNRDGVVNAADYTVWRDTLGSTSDLRANGDNSGASAGIVDAADCEFWRARFGNVAGSDPPASGAASLAAVPEPTVAAMLLGVLVAPTYFRIGRRVSRLAPAG